MRTARWSSSAASARSSCSRSPPRAPLTAPGVLRTLPALRGPWRLAAALAVPGPCVAAPPKSLSSAESSTSRRAPTAPAARRPRALPRVRALRVWGPWGGLAGGLLRGVQRGERSGLDSLLELSAVLAPLWLHGPPRLRGLRVRGPCGDPAGGLAHVVWRGGRSGLESSLEQRARRAHVALIGRSTAGALPAGACPPAHMRPASGDSERVAAARMALAARPAAGLPWQPMLPAFLPDASSGLGCLATAALRVRRLALRSLPAS